ncbi:uncharacterized protein LOC110888535 [Helianthus annuus]|uniref:uncharacterized protein LOC110888535 n=1 Tax=Helianthus annuus TaxID=4232 RepID=UPI000B8F9BA8|nr:uncharacterized protein LOC110888535 [Helianthus annuus]
MARSDLFFTLRYDARGQRGFTNLQKCMSSIRQLAYGYTPDALDEYYGCPKEPHVYVCTGFANGLSNYIAKDTCGDQTQTTFKNYIKHTNKDMVFQECSGALIACTGRGRTALLPGKSQIFDNVVAGTSPDTSFTVSGVEYRRGYYLADGIYPTYSTIVKTIPHPTDDKRKKIAKYQEGARKDIEWAFGVLQKMTYH